MKEKELRGAATCGVCGNKIGESRSPLFFRVKFERHMLNLAALSRQQGLAMMLGGNGLLANVMGPDEDMTEVLDSGTITVCDNCATKSVFIAELARKM